MTKPLLTDAQARVVAHLAHGDTYQQAGQHLHVAASTVKEHRDNAAKRLGARSTPHLVALAPLFRLIPARTALTPQNGDL